MGKCCTIVGVLDNGAACLTDEARGAIESADLIIGSTRLLEIYSDMAPNAKTRDFSGRLKQIPNWVASAQTFGKKIVVLASGDPLCHGMAGFLQKKFGAENLHVIPNVSTLQLAFARLGMTWQDAAIRTVHTAGGEEWHTGATPDHKLYPVRQAMSQHSKLAIFTSPENTPDRIARMIRAEGLDEQWQMAVAENLMRDDECVETWDIREAGYASFSVPNVVILWRKNKAESSVLFGQENLAHDPLFSLELQSVILGKMQLRADSIVWDIGSDRCAIGLQAARLCQQGHVFCFHSDDENIKAADNGRHKMHLGNFTQLSRKAPNGISNASSSPDAIFVAGAGNLLIETIRCCMQKLKPGAQLVTYINTLEQLSNALTIFHQLGVKGDLTQIQIARGQQQDDATVLQPSASAWLITVSS